MRLDKHLVINYGLSRSRAIDLIKLGSVKVNNETILKPSFNVKEEDVISIDDSLKYVSRAGMKLEDAIISFNLDFKDKTLMDIGSSTGGFTECSLSFGAKHVYAYDVGKGQMSPTLRTDARITLKEETNILDVIPNVVDIILIDVSFTSIKPIIKHVRDYGFMFVLLYKPQFEVGRSYVKQGIVKDASIVSKSLKEFTEFLNEEGIIIKHIKPSAIKGKKGNQEYLIIGEKDA